jgi:transcriptional regulator with XRE-family HTH domain
MPMQSAGELVAAARRRHGLTQTQLAARARTSQAAISRIERDVVSPSVSTLANLLDLMGERLTLEAEQIDYGHDRSLFQRTLRETPDRRIANQATWSRGINELKRAARR